MLPILQILFMLSAAALRKQSPVTRLDRRIDVFFGVGAGVGRPLALAVGEQSLAA